MVRRLAPVLAILFACAAAPALAQNPRLDLRLEQVNLAEALEALNKATGISVQLYQPRLPPNFPARPPVPRHLEKTTFNWEGATFAKALRELSERYQVRPYRRMGAYELYPGSPPAKLPDKLTGLVELEGLRLFARSLVLSEGTNRGLNFVGEEPQFGDSNHLTLTISGLLEERDAASLATVENVVALDDRGNRVELRRDHPISISSDFGTFPDEWSCNVSFRLPDPKARKIASVQGDLMIYKWMRPRKAEVPLPLPEKVVKREAGDSTVIFSGYRVLPPLNPEDEKIDIPGLDGNVTVRGRAPAQGPVVRIRVVSHEAQFSGSQRYVAPVAIGASGRKYTGNPLGGLSSIGSGMVRVTEGIYYFPDLEEPAVRLVYETVERGEIVKLTSFRMTDIPLPPPAPGERPAPVPDPRVAEANPQPVMDPLPDHPWVLRGGATLIARVERLGKPVAGGGLELGMARVVGGKAGPVRWTELPVDSRGTARLLHVQPGTYQVHFKFRGSAPAKPGAGKWLNSVATVTLRAGHEATLPPLRWVASPPTR